MNRKVSINQVCTLIGKTRQAYYQALRREADQLMKEDLVLDQVEELRKEQELGTEKLHYLLQNFFAAHHIKMGRDKLHELLRIHKLLIKPRRRYKHTTDSKHPHRIHPNLAKDLEVDGPEQLWVADITYLRLKKGGFCYLSFITDAYSRKVVGIHLSRTLAASGPIAALRMALNSRQYPDSPLVHHSDRGVQYCCKEYIEILLANGITISMSGKGNPYENAIAERVNGIFKNQLGLGRVHDSFYAAQKAVEEALSVYNHKRPHRALGMLTPNQMHNPNPPAMPKKPWWKKFRKQDEEKPNDDEQES